MYKDCSGIQQGYMMEKLQQERLIASIMFQAAAEAMLEETISYSEGQLYGCLGAAGLVSRNLVFSIIVYSGNVIRNTLTVLNNNFYRILLIIDKL